MLTFKLEMLKHLSQEDPQRTCNIPTKINTMERLRPRRQKGPVQNAVMT